MTTAVLTDRERAAVQAYLRLLHTVRAAFDTPGGPPGAPLPPAVPPTVLAEADQALRAAGLSGSEEEFFRLLASWCPEP
ncbi:hypothetical protein AB0E75_32800 [Streptomyces griseoviridis]|jgi:hypothetical protein|uniref:Uncharacterized protein n=3 Tax=Streptomyces TaxID=1883 RepID=A0A918GEW2_STRGD|nr:MULTISPECIES: hypothetical protein [Streptomyces]MDP9685382.1 hypothetical protein [Streptomyces griseoviridis]GGS33377.1 hypothetical protein GCM10010238_23430 [Streptomyces niveoruber]GGS86990.1 hypothetical protein GCM10010240_20430 [Streptomyces griseoviridis]GGU30848.1 hypothetical protein GCM10010259_21820 [Streptomyces daghestanicus]GHI32958.1 hypothetical protein Sdagh_46880 [Streptomyces daghestanicus]